MGMAAKADENLLISGGQTGLAIPGLPAACHITLAQTAAQLRVLAQDWHALEQENQIAPHAFQTFDWCLAWSETYIEEQQGADRLQVIAGYDDNRLVFAFPLMATQRMGQRALVWLTEPFGQYGDVLCAKGQNAKLWIDAALSLMKRFKDVDLIHLRHVREDSIIAKHGLAELINARVPEQAPYLDLTAYPTEADYDARYTSQQRKRRKKIRRALDQFGDVTFRVLPAGITADAAMQTALTEKSDWLSARGRVNRVMSCPGHLRFLKNLSRKNGPLQFVVSELSAGGKPVSWEIGFRSQGVHFAYITSHLNKHTDLSPGRLHMDLSQRACLADGLQRFDLMIPNDAHKESWSSAKIETNDYYIPVSAKGALYGHLYLRLIRPMARDVYYWLEPKILPWLSRKTGKATPTDA
jgi:CelD/BcsL family acetyltransferase involved in cellulose biosynthesis